MIDKQRDNQIKQDIINAAAQMLATLKAAGDRNPVASLVNFLNKTHWGSKLSEPLIAANITLTGSQLMQVADTVPPIPGNDAIPMLGNLYGAMIVYDIFAESWIHPHQDPGTLEVISVVVPTSNVPELIAAVDKYLKKAQKRIPNLKDLMEESGIPQW